jgi:hypothetical protein
MTRREFITLLGAAAAWPLAARAQQSDRVRRIGVLSGLGDNDPEGRARIAAFRDGLQRLGWTEGRNVHIDVRWGTPEAETMQRFAKEVRQRHRMPNITSPPLRPQRRPSRWKRSQHRFATRPRSKPSLLPWPTSRIAALS